MALVHPSSFIQHAADFARLAHRGQTDKVGRDYFDHHVMGVAELLQPYGDLLTISGLLHDTVEDTGVTLEQIEAEFGPCVTQTVDGVTRRWDETYLDMIARAAADPRSRVVKLADNWHNLSTMEGLAQVDPSAAGSLRARYNQARIILLKAQEETWPS